MENTQESDKLLIEKIVFFNDRKAYNTFFHRYYSKLVLFSLYFVKNHENAEDVVEEVFYKFLKVEKKLLKVDNIRSYLFRMTKNECFNFIKKNRDELHIDYHENADDFQFPIEPSPENKLVNKEFEELIHATINSFPPKRKIIFRLSREERLSYPEIAKLLDISTKTVESHMSVALKTLRKNIEEYDSGIDTRVRRIDTQLIIPLLISLFI